MLSVFDGLRDVTTLSVFVRLACALICGGIIGIERPYKRRPAGFRTHILICIGAAITTLTSQYLYLNMHYFTDMARLGAQVVAGIGFIGAGTIIVTKRQRVKGLTTAAGLWTSVSAVLNIALDLWFVIGLTFGGGFYEGGILATVFIMLAELVFSRIEYRVLENVPEINLYMEYEDKHCLDDVLQLYRSYNIKVLNIQITRSAENGEHNACAIFSLRLPRSCGVEKLLTLVGRREGIVSVEEL